MWLKQSGCETVSADTRQSNVRDVVSHSRVSLFAAAAPDFLFIVGSRRSICASSRSSPTASHARENKDMGFTCCSMRTLFSCHSLAARGAGYTRGWRDTQLSHGKELQQRKRGTAAGDEGKREDTELFLSTHTTLFSMPDCLLCPTASCVHSSRL